MMIARLIVKALLMRVRLLSFDQEYPSRIYPLTLKYKEEGKMQVGAHESVVLRRLLGRRGSDNAAQQPAE